jgi:hypothetical protein
LICLQISKKISAIREKSPSLGDDLLCNFAKIISPTISGTVGAKKVTWLPLKMEKNIHFPA